MTERLDEVARRYTATRRLDVASQILFYLAAFMSLLNLHLETLPQLAEFVPVLFIVLVICYAAASSINSMILIPSAENHRRKQLLSDGLGVPLTHHQTRQYYNNGFHPSVERLGANIMENAHFGSNVSARMLLTERIKVGGYLLLWIFALVSRSTDLSWLLVLTQLLFSGEILLKWIRMELFCLRTKRVFQSMYTLFLSAKRSNTAPNHAGILDEFADYETAKAAASFNHSQRIFQDLNSKLSHEWDRIRATIGVP